MPHQISIKAPRKVWFCQDCGTISDVKTSGQYHVGHIGRVTRPKQPDFDNLKRPELLGSGEVIWVNK